MELKIDKKKQIWVEKIEFRIALTYLSRNQTENTKQRSNDVIMQKTENTSLFTT